MPPILSPMPGAGILFRAGWMGFFLFCRNSSCLAQYWAFSSQAGFLSLSSFGGGRRRADSEVDTWYCGCGEKAWVVVVVVVRTREDRRRLWRDMMCVYGCMCSLVQQW